MNNPKQKQKQQNKSQTTYSEESGTNKKNNKWYETQASEKTEKSETLIFLKRKDWTKQKIDQSERTETAEKSDKYINNQKHFLNTAKRQKQNNTNSEKSKKEEESDKSEHTKQDE